MLLSSDALQVSNHVAVINDPFVIASLLPPNIMLDALNLRWTLFATDRCFSNPVLSAFFRCIKVLPVSYGDGIYQKNRSLLNKAIEIATKKDTTGLKALSNCEARGDVARAQEYCEWAILTDQRDGDALSMYGEIIWEQSKDAQRALTYFDRAIQAAPDDCYVMASYARFLWDADEEEKENQVKNDVMESVNRTTPSIAAAS